MEVENRLGVCKNSPAERDYFENGVNEYLRNDFDENYVS